jgi:hypothetical protein
MMMRREITPENFSEMKTHMLTMIEKRRTMLDTQKTCVEAAKNAEELKACRPERPMGMGGCAVECPAGSKGPGQPRRGSRERGSEYLFVYAGRSRFAGSIFS